MRSRREWIGWLLALPAVVGLAKHGMAETSGKITKAAAKYQEGPKNGQMCRTCKLYIPPGTGPEKLSSGTCQVVEGNISPVGWCVLYQPLKS